MNSIYYNYFFPRTIFLLMFLIIGYSILKKGLPKWSLIFFIPCSLFFGFHTFSGPNIFENIFIYEKMNNLKTENIKEIDIFDISLTGNNNTPIPNSLYSLRDKKDIDFIVKNLKDIESHNENVGIIEKFYGLKIILNDKSKIEFKVIKSKENIFIELLSKKKGKYYTIGTYKNFYITNILLE